MNIIAYIIITILFLLLLCFIIYDYLSRHFFFSEVFLGVNDMCVSICSLPHL